MEESIYDNLPDDPELAFVHLEAHYKTTLDEDLQSTDQGSNVAYYRSQYCNKVIAAAKALDIAHLKDVSLPDVEGRNSWEVFDRFESDVQNLIIQIRINHARRAKKFSVALDGTAKQKIRHFIEQIRLAIEASDIPQNKKDKIFEKLADLTLEIDRDRTRFEVIADAVRAVARLSGDVEREGAEPWYKWFKLIWGEVDEAKENEPKPSLPAPGEKKQLEPPRKQLPKPESRNDFGRSLDDDIPF